MSFLRRATGFVRDVARGARDDRITGLAAEVAYFGMVSIFPGLLAVAAAVTLLDRLGARKAADEVEHLVVGWAEGLFTERASGVTEAVQALFERGNGDVFTIASLVALWSGSRGVDAVIRAVVLVANDVDRRSWVRRRLLSLGLLVGTVVAGAIVISMFVVGPLLGGGQAVADALSLGDAFATTWNVLRIPTAAAALTGWALIMLHVARPAPGPWTEDLPGALTTMVLWILVTVGLRVYLGTLASFNAVLGTLGGALIALLWLYLLAASLLVGAEVAQRMREDPHPG